MGLTIWIQCVISGTSRKPNGNKEIYIVHNMNTMDKSQYEYNALVTIPIQYVVMGVRIWIQCVILGRGRSRKLKYDGKINIGHYTSTNV